ncbi:hypothetical protein MNBD_ALPHA02-1391 [hydrothermal vent metagenome]|uniref:Uncharacterized protein n=1 Tax=hydrothermal vent metagenome TaxID=652676 RepID=A0A3B0R6L4_9ZZZZ
MTHVILRVQGTESSLPLADLTIGRILAEARAVGLEEFAVLCNGEEIASPEKLSPRAGDVFVLLPADYEDAEITVDISNEPANDPQ